VAADVSSTAGKKNRRLVCHWWYCILNRYKYESC
jgi:hypothetical protein